MRSIARVLRRSKKEVQNFQESILIQSLFVYIIKARQCLILLDTQERSIRMNLKHITKERKKKIKITIPVMKQLEKQV